MGKQHILMVAAENDALPGGKVGGLGDVIRDLPRALVRSGQRVTVLTPAYGVFAELPEASLEANLEVEFCGRAESLTLHRIALSNGVDGLTTLVLDHPLFASGGAGRIYVADDAGPFATDAHKFALFCLAAAEAQSRGLLGEIDVLHCHDWHTALLLFLRRFAERFRALRPLHTVFTIHNLSLQGVRPFQGVPSSLENWVQGLHYESEAVIDPHHPDCINLMRTGINLAERVHTPSPGYAEEIQRPSDWSEGHVGGEGLEADLQRAREEGRLVGILNGCEYPETSEPTLSRKQLWAETEKALDGWAASSPHPSHYFALKRLLQFRRRRKPLVPLVTSIGRLTAQKVGLLTQSLEHQRDGELLMDEVLRHLDGGAMILLGSGEAELEHRFAELMLRHDNFLFLRGYSDRLAGLLYGAGDLFLMPSVYEPCGISQLLAMRAGTPCLVNGVGGLKDTVDDGIDGFVFEGKSMQEKLKNLLLTLDRAVKIRKQEPARWQVLEEGAAAARFDWQRSLDDYLQKLYSSDAN